MLSFIFSVLGYFFLFGAIAGLLQGEILTGSLFIPVAITLLVKSKHANKALAKILQKKEIPTKSGWLHLGVAFLFLMIAGVTIPKNETITPPDPNSANTERAAKEESQPNNSKVIERTAEVEDQASTETAAELPPCIKLRLKDASAIWDELKGYRYDSEFHTYGLSAGGPFSNWNIKRQEGLELYQKCQNALGQSQKFNYMGLAQSYTQMYYIAKDWYSTKGKGKSDTANFISDVEYALSNGGKAKQ